MPRYTLQTHDTQHKRKDIFKLLHNTKKTTPKQKHITYRLLYGITGTQSHTQLPCTTCGRVLETEHHIFWQCRPKLRETLIAALRLPINIKHSPAQNHENILKVAQRAVFLNLFPFKTPVTGEIRNVILGIYREVLWHARNNTQHHNYRQRDEQLDLTFRNRIKHTLEQKFTQTEIHTYNTHDRSTLTPSFP